jgi:ABC-2 type transport system permease protein
MKPGTLKIVTRYEWRMLKAERLAHLIALLFLAVMSYAVLNGFAGLRERNAKAAAEERKLDQLFADTRRKVEEYERKLITEGKSPDAPSSEINSAHLLRFELSDFAAVLPPNGFAAASVGLREVAPQAYAYEKYREDASNQPTVEARSLGGVFPEKQQVNPLRMFTGRFDLAFATIFITPLLILALSFNLIGADKESGILALMMTQGISLPGILLGKTLVRFLLVFACGVLTPGLAVYFGHLFFHGDSQSGAARVVDCGGRPVCWVLVCAGLVDQRIRAQPGLQRAGAGGMLGRAHDPGAGQYQHSR